MPSQILRSLDDDARDAQTVGERLELHAFDSDRQRHADLLAPLGPDLVGLNLLTAIGRRPLLVSGQDGVVRVPAALRVLDAHLDLAGVRAFLLYTAVSLRLAPHLIHAVCRQ